MSWPTVLLVACVVHCVLSASSFKRTDVDTVNGRILQQRANAETSGLWDSYATHRRRVMELLPPLGDEATIALLGAGNCNDVELVELSKRFAFVTLADVDGGAVNAALERQRVDAGRIDVVETDLTGAVDLLEKLHSARLGKKKAAAKKIDGLLSVARSGPNPLGFRQFHCVASLAMISQIVWQVDNAIPTEHPRYHEIILSLRDAHLRHVITSLAHGGRGVLVVDFVSQQTLPDLSGAEEGDLSELMHTALEEYNFFHGTNPYAIAEKLRANALVDRSSVAVSAPWRWTQRAPSDGTEARVFLVAAVTFRRNDVPLPPG